MPPPCAGGRGCWNRSRCARVSPASRGAGASAARGNGRVRSRARQRSSTGAASSSSASSIFSISHALRSPSSRSNSIQSKTPKRLSRPRLRSLALTVVHRVRRRAVAATFPGFATASWLDRHIIPLSALASHLVAISSRGLSLLLASRCRFLSVACPSSLSVSSDHRGAVCRGLSQNRNQALPRGAGILVLRISTLTNERLTVFARASSAPPDSYLTAYSRSLLACRRRLR